MKKQEIYIGTGAIFMLVLFIWLFANYDNRKAVAEIKPSISEKIKIEPRIEYGLNLDSFSVVEQTVKPSQFLSNILTLFEVPYSKIHQLSQFPDSVFNVRRITVGSKYLIAKPINNPKEVAYFIYRPNQIDYIVCDLRDSVKVKSGKKPIEKKVRALSGIITSSLYDALTENGGDPMLSLKMADIMAWTIDFYRIQKEDWFKVIYEESYVDGESIGIGDIYAIDFNHEGRDFYGFKFEQDGNSDFFDEEANSLRKAFLKSPLKFSRLTSGYTKRRFHPVQKRWKAHLGTDYAAPRGTPILATGDGKVVEATFKKYNGRYVKIKHNGTYTTQYLHMNAIANGIKPGIFVKQGEVIGYVGSTGLATGPHVCYRFWKNGQQVNHLREDFPPSEPVKVEHLERFAKEIDNWTRKLNQIPFKSKAKPLASL